MRFTYSFPVLKKLSDEFYCRPRRKKLNLDKCLEDFVEANAYEKKRSVCWRCPQGRRNREHFSNC